ncbi:heavy-metal-associated domain-containing protein [Polaribacter marinivivus]|uniref:heavy-metal-associated domain-containing protein n=1 Tax=Polaribacter marinivivus TaxID=1524260 RepID=UPI003D32CBD6
MKHVYRVSGMTCNGCKNSVEKSLSEIENIKHVSVDLEKETVAIKMKQHLEVAVLQNVLSEKFTITELKDNHTTKSVNAEAEEKSTIKQLYPLFLIFAFITTAAVLININPWNTSEFMLTFMGLFYVVFSFFKLLDVKGFAMSFSMYDPLAKTIPSYGLVYPFIELALGIFFLMRFQIVAALLITLVILGVTTIGVTKSLLDKKAIKCACLGAVLNLPITKATFIENTIMIVMAIFMLINLL